MYPKNMILNYKEITAQFLRSASRILPYTVYVCMREAISGNQRWPLKS